MKKQNLLEKDIARRFENEQISSYNELEYKEHRHGKIIVATIIVVVIVIGILFKLLAIFG